jgi:hypothetical protein
MKKRRRSAIPTYKSGYYSATPDLLALERSDRRLRGMVEDHSWISILMGALIWFIGWAIRFVVSG